MDGEARGAWRKSGFSSGANSMCVEVSAGATWHDVRDSKDPSGAVVRVPAKGWQDLLTALRAGEF